MATLWKLTSMRGALNRGGFALAQTAVTAFAATGDTALVANPSEDFDYDYVLDCQPTANKSGLALALSNCKIQLRSLETLGLMHEFHAHNSTINEVWTSPSSPFQLATCSSDECVKLWDTRTALPAMVLPVGREVWSLSIGCGETLLATGTDELALFYDVRTGNKLGQYGESHVDAITKVRFHPTQPAFVVTASEDGVVCFFDCRIPDEDDERVSSMLRVPSPPSASSVRRKRISSVSQAPRRSTCGTSGRPNGCTTTTQSATTATRTVWPPTI
ncbi:hypothetical protein F442_06841 [Phytophthora nicotianae P10297]|uniref:Uncharacterized protein n=1 Tax=Phytophthora nicotianae P10297 TaxID=1317064 RepID=W2ZI02_PHYNI|nr:hypothetical protein F442_06841 [Phytophthora nicotianae P10297]